MLKLIVESLGFFGADAGDLNHLKQAGGDGGFQFVVIRELAGGGEQSDFFLKRLTDALDVSESFLRDDFIERFTQALQRPGGVGIGAAFERDFRPSIRAARQSRKEPRQSGLCP